MRRKIPRSLRPPVTSGWSTPTLVSSSKPWSWRLRKRWVIDPRVQHWLAYWDLMTASALVFTAIVTPVEVSFVESPKWADKWSNPLFLTNRAVDFVFIIDMALQFRVAYKSGGIHEGTRWHVAPSEIANHYVRSKWFYIDGFSILTSIFDVIPNDVR